MADSLSIEEIEKALRRRFASTGGKASAAALSKAARVKRAKKAARARWAKNRKPVSNGK